MEYGEHVSKGMVQQFADRICREITVTVVFSGSCKIMRSSTVESRQQKVMSSVSHVASPAKGSDAVTQMGLLRKHAATEVSLVPEPLVKS